MTVKPPTLEQLREVAARYRLLEVYGRGRLAQADELSETTKLVVLLGQYLQDTTGGR